MTGTALVIGYGNSLRGDDGIGPGVAGALAKGDPIDRAQVIVCHQLTPELAECIAAADLVVFIDAAVNIDPGTVAVREVLDASPPSSGLFHSATPAALLGLARHWCGK